MKKRSPARAVTARKRQVRSPMPPVEPASDAIDSTPRVEWDPDRSEVERPSAPQRLSIETASRNPDSGGVEAPESLSEEKKASPFE